MTKWDITELKLWVRLMRWFRVIRAVGGHANDGDRVAVALSYDGRTDLLALFHILGIQPIIHATQPPQPIPGKPYLFAEMNKFPSLITDFPWIEQPGHCVIHGIAVFIWCSHSVCDISVRSNVDHGYSIDAGTIATAIQLEEAIIKDLSNRIIDPPEDSERCFCPKYHPELWTDTE